MAYTINITQLADAELAARIAEGQAAQTAAEAAQSGAEAARDTTLSYRDTTLGYRDTAEAHKDSAAVSAALAAAEAAGIVGYDLSAIADTIAATAVEVYVYDTTQDSDGGAWRNRCQHTSWYNETLNTATRGARQEFPVKALIVAEAATVTIYDLDDPAVPMWRVITQTSLAVYGTDVWRFGRVPSSVTAKDGRIAWGQVSGVPLGLSFYNFAGDVAGKYSATSTYSGTVPLGLALTTSIKSGSLPTIVSETVNDVAITTLPGAPIDDQTGLPVPTIAVATDGGVSVIRDDGTVVDSSSGSAKIAVAFDGRTLTFVNDSNGSTWVTSSYAADGFGANVTYNVTGTAATQIEFSSTTSLVSEGLGSSDGITLLATAETQSNSMHANITADYATGWMHGDVKGAFLCEASEDDLVGGELITNGDDWTGASGTTPPTGWATSSSTVTFSVSTGDLTIDRAGEATPYDMSQSVTTVAGLTYVLDLNLVSVSGGNQLRVDIDGAAASYATSTAITFVAGDTSTSIGLRNTSTTGNTVIGSLSVKLATQDRSVNANGLAVTGTITVAPVETGAETMAYSGYSASNYLSQPYNSALDFGTGDFYVMGWAKILGTAGAASIFSRTTDASTGGCIELRKNSGDPTLRFNTGATGYDEQLNSTLDIPSEEYFFFCAMRYSGVKYLYINNQLAGTQTSTANVSNTTDPLIIGNRYDLTLSFPGSLSRWRIGAGAPTPEQIKKIYRDELPLYREDAACTLNGTSSAVTAMSSDPVTGLLQVGTSGGLSAFRGLQRVEQDTTAVTTTISANGATVARQ